MSLKTLAFVFIFTNSKRFTTRVSIYTFKNTDGRAIRSKLGFSILDTSTCRLAEAENELPNLKLVADRSTSGATAIS